MQERSTGIGALKCPSGSSGSQSSKLGIQLVTPMPAAAIEEEECDETSEKEDINEPPMKRPASAKAMETEKTSSVERKVMETEKTSSLKEKQWEQKNFFVERKVMETEQTSLHNFFS